MMLLYNGYLLPEVGFSLPLPNRGLFFNDGFFETMVWTDEQVHYARFHVARMQRAAAALKLEVPAALASSAALQATVRHLVAACEPSNTGHRVRLQLWRSGGGLYTPTTTAAEWLMTQQPFQAMNAPIRHCGIAQRVRTHPSPVSFCKGPNALTYVLAAQERQQRGLDELVIVSQEGYVAETVAASIAWIKGNTVYSPAESTGCVAGTRLAHLREAVGPAGLNWELGNFRPEEMLQAEAVFTANIAGIRAVAQIEGVDFFSEQHPLLQQLRALDDGGNFA
ncbi:aminotransferase class IV [Hymenobacter endophyticus]|uniref:Aminotransferase class IV n=1 Tax=Hymenobacter endophyticus TaxID=3076335 RepID=A0ABU3TF84_9BACT|nr:aminotransferase class IV [Hymenobacter endophyticus]MDU0370014.1 aminotransferase class IV [Hymenobacter endophyticus]